VPGIDAVPINPRWLTLNVNGAPPMLALSPLLDRFNLRPGTTVNDLRNRQPIGITSLFYSRIKVRDIMLQLRTTAKYTKVR
jgi:hypothetical protein